MTFVDTAKFYLDAATPTRKKGIVLMDSIQRLPVPAIGLEPLKLDVYSSENIRHDVKIREKTIVLKEAEVKAKKIDTERPKADKVHMAADYVVTEEWIRKSNVTDVTSALARKVPGMSSGRVTLGTPTGFGGAGPPLLIVDGIAQVVSYGDDIALMLNDIPIRSIERIEILKNASAASYGSRGANGVIVIYTKKGTGTAASGKGFDKAKLQAVTLMGYSPLNTFTSPDYSKPVDNYFDYRPTLTWQPNVSLDGKKMAIVTFYAADAATKYRIVVEGVTKDGKPVRGEKVISVVTGK
jgi:TonB-dependent SusC/RagA subfamily outer membrane receptor